MKLTIDIGFFMFSREVGPARIRLQIRQTGVFVQLRAGFVERRNTRFSTASQVEHRQVEGQAQQIGTDVVDNELVDLVAHVAGKAADNVRVDRLKIRAAGDIGLRIKEHSEERLSGLTSPLKEVKVVVQTIDRTGKHGVTEAIDRMREFGDDRRINIGAGVENEGVNHRLDAPCELFKHHVLVLHLGAEPRGLEQSFAVPGKRIGEGSQHRWICRNCGYLSSR